MKLTAAKRKELKPGAFALPDRRYPIENASHARNALARVSQHGSPSEKAEVRAKVKAHFPAIAVSGKGGKKPERTFRGFQ